MNVLFRNALQTDLTAIIEMLQDDEIGSSRETAELGSYETIFETILADEKVSCVVGEFENRIVAYYQFNVIDGLSHNALRRGQIEDVRVVSDLRGQGIGRLLIIDAELRARDVGCGVLQLVAHKTREKTRRFYEAQGFTASHNGFKRSI